MGCKRRNLVLPIKGLKLVDKESNIYERMLRKGLFREPRREVKIEVMQIFEVPLKDLDPLSRVGVTDINILLITFDCGPTSTNTWVVDSQPDCPIGSYDFGKCMWGTLCYPVLGIYPFVPSNPNANTACDLARIAVPEHVKNVSPCNGDLYCSTSLVPKLPTGLMLKGVNCDDVNNKALFNSFSARDDSASTYTVGTLALGELSGTPLGYITHSYYTLPTSQQKGSTDIFYYIYRIGFYYV